MMQRQSIVVAGMLQLTLNVAGTIHFNEFLTMMLGGKSSILKMILMFEEMNKEKETPKGLPAKRSLGTCYSTLVVSATPWTAIYSTLPQSRSCIYL